MERSLRPELLDSLPPSHPDALHNRRDLRLTNVVMGNHAWVVATVARYVGKTQRILEIGAGTGELAAKLIARGYAVDGLDLWPQPDSWPAGRLWHQTDVNAFADWDRYDVLVGNLIFHQFSADDLRLLGQQLESVSCVIACEPVRSRAAQLAFAAIAPLLGANHVSLHDAHVSIAAGFRNKELPEALGLREPHWRSVCKTSLLGAYRMIARRTP